MALCNQSAAHAEGSVSVNVVTDSELKGHIDALLTGPLLGKGTQAWMVDLELFLPEVAAAIPERLSNADFLLRLWNDNPVTSTGSGSVRIEPALQDPAFVDWFCSQMTQALPQDPLLAEARLITLYNGLVAQLRKRCDRLPRLKLNRVLCAFYPEHFTSLADLGRLRELHLELGGNRNDHPVQMHKAIRQRTDQALAKTDAPVTVTEVTRICVPWLLYERLNNDSAIDGSALETPTQSGLVPLPARLRRKGLTALGGGLETLLSLLPGIAEEVTRDEFVDLLRQNSPELRDSSVNTMVNVVAREFDLCKQENGIYRLSPRGSNLLETQDPDELADHLLTRVLGTDHVIKALSGAPHRRAELIELLQRVNPGWTKPFAPSSLINWLRSLDVITQAGSKSWQLTERGQRWAEMIAWEPEFLSGPAQTVVELQETLTDSVELPTLQTMLERIQELAGKRLALSSTLISQLHAGLWFHPVRHFAVLTGISGSGKTQLALNYALALGNTSSHDSPRVRVIPVQPGWYDPSPLLGYVNPVQESSYRTTPFLELLLQAAEEPETPFVAILDEMNLSHPEQYMAPILSAMETHGWLDLHQLGEDLSLVPQRIRYPANLAIIGTLNMDETTHGLSDKVLDRACTLEFWEIDVKAFPGWETTTLSAELKQVARTLLVGLSEALTPIRLHFGWRIIDDVLGYLSFQQANGRADSQALDDILYAKVLPKLRGEHSPRFVEALEKVRAILQDHGMKRCAEKVQSLQTDLVETGSARFWR